MATAVKDHVLAAENEVPSMHRPLVLIYKYSRDFITTLRHVASRFPTHVLLVAPSTRVERGRSAD